MNFYYIVIISHYKKPSHIIEETWIPLIASCKNVLCQVWLKFAQWFLRRRFLNVINAFSLFRNYLPLEKGVILHLNKLEFPSPKDALCQVWLKLVKRFYSWRFLNFPFDKGVALYVNKLEFPSPKKCFVLNFVEIGSLFPEKKILKFRQCIFAIS